MTKIVLALNRVLILEKRIINLLTNLASLFLKMMRGINDQRIIGFVALTIGVMNIWQSPDTVYLNVPTIQILQRSLSIDFRIYTDLMIISGVYLVLSQDITSRWFLAASLPLQFYIATAILGAETTTISQHGFQVGDLVIAVIIYRQIIKLILLEIINNYNSNNDLANGGQVNGKHGDEPNITSSDSWYSGNLGINLATVGTSDQPVVAEQDERSSPDN